MFKVIVTERTQLNVPYGGACLSRVYQLCGLLRLDPRVISGVLPDFCCWWTSSFDDTAFARETSDFDGEFK
ncbi:hypothetical protein JOB18_032854 [Solea senegalensis]|uniref:Uncharacterized protein n=1 Tax=Solea senegalensis TaxID=28829 RepID=A0AAV6SFD6_SOLSE|nr:hypothetical protein JOB18_032854 [Solea senegalensis]